jgi:ankyrin repeat protein
MATLHDAAKKGDLEEARRLLSEKSVTVNGEDRLHRTPLHLACWAGKPEMVQLLLEHK